MLDDVRRDHHGLSGVLRITSTPEYGAQVVVPALAAFSRQHPRLRIQHVSSSYHADLISGALTWRSAWASWRIPATARR